MNFCLKKEGGSDFVEAALYVMLVPGMLLSSKDESAGSNPG